MSGVIWKAYEGSKPIPVIKEVASDCDPGEALIEMITVHLVGAVNNPGVYQLPAGSRVYQLIEAGGGFTANAEDEAVNQARPLIDGEQVHIYQTGDLPDHKVNSSSALVNINRADVSELMTLPGIGEVKARQIIDYREKRGLFTDIKQIMSVSGIGEKTFENIAELITVY